MCRVIAGFAFIRKQRRVLPYRLAIFAPENAQRPARQLLAGIPLALAKMQKAALPVFSAQLLQQLSRVTAFGGAEGINIPLCCVAAVGRDKSRLTPHGQAHVALDEFTVNRFAKRQHFGPLVFGIRLGNARRFVNALHAHVVGELDLGLIHATFNWRGA